MTANNPVRAIIIDDEISAVQLLQEMLVKIEGISVVGYALDVESALNLILQHQPEIVFLDIRLKNENGFELIHKLKDYDADPFFVMVTGFDQYGLDAIKAGAFDYLLKPVVPGELLKVISRYRQKQAKLQQTVPVKKIRFNTLGGFILINPEEIFFCKAEANYTDIFLTNQQKHTISLNIGSIEKILTDPKFFRISRSHLINLRFLTGINRGKRQCLLSVNQSSVPLPISHDRIKELEEALVQ